jgi:hypothetical protein
MGRSVDMVDICTQLMEAGGERGGALVAGVCGELICVIVGRSVCGIWGRPSICLCCVVCFQAVEWLSVSSGM